MKIHHFSFASIVNMKTLLLFSMALMTLGNVSCKKKNSTPINTVAALDLKDVAYGTDPLQKMDVYLPANRTSANTKALVLIHGGAWVSGDKADFNDVVTALKPLLPDFAFFNINYRLAAFPNVNVWPTQLNDVNAALSFINSKGNEYLVNTSKMGIGGASAGGHLALMKAYQSPASFKAVADLFGPTDMKDMYNSNPSYQMVLGLFMNGTPTSNAAAYTAASPLYLVNASSPPTIIFHGTLDNLVPVHQSDSLNNRLANANVTRQYVKYVGEGHGWTGSNLTDTYVKLAAFIKQHVQ